MNSLVGYGVSSESDSDGDGVDITLNHDGVNSVKEENDDAPDVKKTRNFLLESDSASSDLSSESEEEVPDPSSSSSLHLETPARAPYRPTDNEPTHPAPSLGSHNPSKLPPPPLNAFSDGSVFANPFKAQAEQKLNALQKHVPLTMQAKPSQIGGKRMCVSYRKDGKCRFGIKCKFAHDSDLQITPAPTDSHPPVRDEGPVSEHVESHAGGSCGGGSQNLTEEEESRGQQRKKRRVGLSDTLIPPKRAMKQYAIQRDREQIDMS